MTDETPPAPKKKKPPRKYPLKYRKLMNQELACKGVPPEERRALPAPKLLSGIYQEGKLYVIDIEVPEGKKWCLASVNKGMLRRKLLYFRALGRDVVYGLLPAIPVTMMQWKRVKGWKCSTCGGHAREKIGDKSVWGCASCQIETPKDGQTIFSHTPSQKPNPVTNAAKKEKKAKKPVELGTEATHVAELPVVPPVAEKPSKSVKKKQPKETEQPKPSLSLKDRLAMMKKK